MNALSDLAGDAEQPADAVVISAIGGAAGIGKTALAVHWAHLVAGQFPDGQLYADLRGFGPAGEPVSAAQAARAFLCALGVTREAIPAEADALVGLYRSLLAGRRMLVVLDNVRDEGQVRPLLPGAAGCLVLVTSRNQLTGLAATEGARLLALGEFTEREAREFLVGRLGAERVEADPKAVSELIMLCTRLPLALAITAARAAAQPSYPLADLVAELRDVGGPLDALETGEAVGNIRAVFSWSYRLLSPPAARLFRCLGLHSGSDVSVLAAASMAGLRVAQARQLLTELGRSHLINEHVLGRHALHDLLRVYAAEQACAEDGEADRRVAIDQILDHYLHTAYTAALLLSPLRDPITLTEPGSGVMPEQLASYEEALYWFEAEHKVLLAAVNLAAATRQDSRAWQLPWALADFLDRRGHWNDWAAIQRTAVEAAACIGDTSAQALAHRRPPEPATGSPITIRPVPIWRLPSDSTGGATTVSARLEYTRLSASSPIARKAWQTRSGTTSKL